MPRIANRNRIVTSGGKNRPVPCGTSDPAHTKIRVGHPIDFEENRRVVLAEDELLPKKIEVDKYS